MTHLSLRDQDLAEEYYTLSLQRIRKIMNVTHRSKRFLNNSAQRHGFRLNKLLVKMLIGCDTRSPEVLQL